MAMKVDDVVAQALALPTEDRAKIVARIQASLAVDDAGVTTAPRPARSDVPEPTRLLDLAGTGHGLWGDDSSEHLRKLRDEWR